MLRCAALFRLSPLIIFFEHQEETAIATAPMTYKPKLWKRYVDDVLEFTVSNEAVNDLTDNLSTIDDTNFIKFTYQEEKEH